MQLVAQQQVLLAQEPFLLEQGLELLLELALVDLGELANQRLQLANVLVGVGQLPLDRLQFPLVPFGWIAHGMAAGPGSRGQRTAAWQPWASRRKQGRRKQGRLLAGDQIDRLAQGLGPCPLRPPVPAAPSGRPPGDGDRPP